VQRWGEGTWEGKRGEKKKKYEREDGQPANESTRTTKGRARLLKRKKLLEEDQRTRSAKDSHRRKGGCLDTGEAKKGERGFPLSFALEKNGKRINREEDGNTI